ncbi:MAG: hypothetical protein IMZ57_01335 [Acidobacteria bacterium]|nr:hypothetical protein [Acidobacteriota bacterium]
MIPRALIGKMTIAAAILMMLGGCGGGDSAGSRRGGGIVVRGYRLASSLPSGSPPGKTVVPEKAEDVFVVVTAEVPDDRLIPDEADFARARSAFSASDPSRDPAKEEDLLHFQADHFRLALSEGKTVGGAVITGTLYAAGGYSPSSTVYSPGRTGSPDGASVSVEVAFPVDGLEVDRTSALAFREYASVPVPPAGAADATLSGWTSMLAAFEKVKSYRSRTVTMAAVLDAAGAGNLVSTEERIRPSRFRSVLRSDIMTTETIAIERNVYIRVEEEEWSRLILAPENDVWKEDGYLEILKNAREIQKGPQVEMDGKDVCLYRFQSGSSVKDDQGRVKESPFDVLLYVGSADNLPQRLHRRAIDGNQTIVTTFSDFGNPFEILAPIGR